MKEVNDMKDMTEYIKLTHNSRGYSWDIKINDLDIERLTKLNEEMLNKYGQTESWRHRDSTKGKKTMDRYGRETITKYRSTTKRTRTQ